MHLVIHDARLRKVAFVDNTKQNTLKYIKYEWYRSLETAGSTFTVTIQKKAIQTDNHYDVAYNHLNERSFITFKAKNKTHLFSVMVVTEDEETITCTCESSNLELINEYANPYKATKAMSFVEYCNAMDLLNFTYLSVGINEISDQKRTLEWEGQDTKLARLLSLAKKFDAEIEFDTRLNADSSIKQFILNVYHKNDDTHQGVGRIREDVQLVYGKNVKSITRTIDKTNVVNAIRPTGTKDGNTVVISGLSAWEEKNKDGVVEFYQKGEMLYAPISMQLYPSTFTHSTTNDQWTRKDITVDSDNPTVIRAEGIKALQRLAYPSITYEVDGFFDGEIGDTVKVIDHGFVPKLILKARVIEQYIYDDETKNKTVLGNFTALENRISDDMQARLNELVEQAKPYTIKLSTDNGVVFKNNIGQSIVTPTLYKGGKPVVADVIWRWALDGNVTIGTTYTMRGADVTDTATLTVSAYIGNNEVATDEVSFVNVSDGAQGTPGPKGADGRTPYLHIAYATNATGTAGFSTTDSAGRTYIGQYTDNIEADSADPTKYKWTLIKGENGQSSYTHTAYAWSDDGADRFTTVYPKENFLTNTSFKNGLNNWSANSWTIDNNVVHNGNPTVKGVFTGASQSWEAFTQTVSINGLSENDDVVWSVWAKSDSAFGELHLEIWGSEYFTNINVGTEWTRISIKGKLKSVFSVFVWNTKAGTYWISEPKLEKGTELTPYVPASSEDYSNAYPAYIGIYTNSIEEGSNNPNDYTWTRILGQGGVDGKTQYTHIAYADNETGGGFSQTDQTKAYIGMYQDFTATNSTNPASYKWTKWKGSDGDQGIPGPKGEDGQTPYVHFAYSENADGTGLTTSDNGQRYIGHYSDYTQADSTDKTKYTWADRWAKIDVGNGNLLRWSTVSSENMKFFVKSASATLSVEQKDGKTAYKIAIASSVPDQGNGVFLASNENPDGQGPLFNLYPNRKYTFTFSVWSSVAISFDYFSLGHHQVIGGTNVIGDRDHQHRDASWSVSTIKQGEWQRVSYSFTAISLSYFRPFFWFLPAGIEIYIADMMLSDGNIELPWEPSHFDLESSINSKADIDKVVYKTDISVTDEGIVHSASKTVNGQTIASMIAQRAEWVEIIAQLLKVNGDMIVDGAITGKKLNVNELSSITSNIGTVTAGQLDLIKKYPASTGSALADDGVEFTYQIPEHETHMTVSDSEIFFKSSPKLSASSNIANAVILTKFSEEGLTFTFVENKNPLLVGGVSLLHNVGTSIFDMVLSSHGKIQINADNYATNYADSILKFSRQGPLVTVMFNATSNITGNFTLGNLPEMFRPVISTMKSIPEWLTGNHKRCQINTDGNLIILGAVSGQRYASTVSFLAKEI